MYFFLNVGVEGALRIEKIPEEVPIEAVRLLSLLLYYYYWLLLLLLMLEDGY